MVDGKERKDEYNLTPEKEGKKEAENRDQKEENVEDTKTDSNKSKLKENCSKKENAAECQDNNSVERVNVSADKKDEEKDKLNRKELINRLNKLEEDVASLEEENQKYQNKLQRLQADFVNYRKRVKKEKAGLSLEAKIELINELLPVIDNFERALASEDESSNLREGVEMIYKQLMNTLKQEGLEVIPTVDEEFDHTYHEAIMQVEDTDKDSGIIIEELQKGYMLEGKVIRPAMVKVAQ